MSNTQNDRLLAGRYQLVNSIGQGAMGKVYLAKDTRLGGVSVAVKFLSQTMLNQKMRKRFFREAEICAKLGEKSIHIVRVRDYGVDEHDVPFYVMELLQGHSLSDVIKSGSIPLSRFVRLVQQICLGLHSAHDGIVYQGYRCSIIHRDIKPSNILVIQNPTLGELVKVLDFGIAKLILSDGAQTHSFMGTLAYCSPEQIEGRELDSGSDIYSLGVVMYEMLTGDMPIFPENNSFGGWFKAHHEQPPKPFRQDLVIPEGIKSLVLDCLAKKPSDRPQNVKEITEILKSLEKEVARTPEVSIPPSPMDTTSGEHSTLSLEKFCLQHAWPKDKPQRKIVFPTVLSTPKGLIPTLWVMLSQQDINHRYLSRRYNQFICVMSPHPMLLWLTVLYNRESGPSWLPCYLDLRTKLGQQMAIRLSKYGSYRLLFFALENPQKCQNVVKLTVDPLQCKNLLKWAQESRIIKPSGSPQMSKGLLKREFDKIKPHIDQKLYTLTSKPV